MCRCCAPSGRTRRPAPVLPAAVLPAAAGSRYAVSIQQSYIPASRSPAAKLHQNCIKKHKKASKSPAFCAAYRRKRHRSASTDSTLKSPVSGAFWAAVDAAQSQKRYLKPSTWWGAAPFRAGGKAPMPRIQTLCLCSRHKCRLQILPALSRKYAPRQRRRISTLSPLVWLLHRLTRRAERVYMSRRRDYAAPPRRGAQ